MTPQHRKFAKWTILALLVLATIAITAMYQNAGRYGQRLQNSLTRALGRRVEFRTPVEFSLLHGPALLVKDVTIHEDPSIGLEPIVYVHGGSGGGGMTVRPSLWSLLGGRFVIASIRLEGASINLTKSGPAGEWGRWNFSTFVDRSTIYQLPAIHIRGSRINVKFGDDKSPIYLAETDLDISPPGSIGHGWSVECSAKPARTDRTHYGLGEFTLTGRWFVNPQRVDLDLELDKTGLSEWTALFRGESGSVQGTLSSRIHLGGPIQNIGIDGRLRLEDVHRWDMMPPYGSDWPLQVRGRLDLIGQQLELQTTTEGSAATQLAIRFRAANYLTQPRWGVSISGSRFPLEPFMELSRHMGVVIPEKLKLAGAADGGIGYSPEGGIQGAIAFHGAALTIPDSPPLQIEQAYLVLGQGHARLSPTLVGTADDQARIEADYALDTGALDLSIAADSMNVSSLRAQVALAAVPWLEQLRSGRWKGQLHYHRGADHGAATAHTGVADRTGWSGALDISDAELPVPGLADPLKLTSAHAQIDGVRVVLDRVRAQAGKLSFTGEYRYEPASTRPHRLRLRCAAADAADLEAELSPSLRRGTGLLARALGRAPVPDWLRTLGLEGTVQIDDLTIGGVHLDGFRGHLVWIGERADLDGIRASINNAVFTGSLGISLLRAHPTYRLAAKIRGLDYLSGKLDADGIVETYGTGLQLLTNLSSDGAFTGAAWDLGAPTECRSVTGSYHLTWAGASPRLHLTDLSLRDSDDTYTGNGATAENGRIIVQLSNGAREMRVTGPLAKLKVEEGK